MIALRLGPLLVTLPTVEQAVELLALLDLAGRFPLPGLEETAPEPEPAPPVQLPPPVKRSVAPAPEKAPLTVRSQPSPTDIDGRILEAFRQDASTPLHRIAADLFGEGRANAVRLLKLRIVSLEASGQLHRVGVGRYALGPSKLQAQKRRGRPSRATTYAPAHRFDDEEDRAEGEETLDLDFDTDD
jgi:hypothetical protein